MCSVNFLALGMSPKSMKRAQGGAAAVSGAGLHPEHSAQVRGVSPNEVPMADMSPPDHVIPMEDHYDSGDQGLAERVISKLDFLHPSGPTHEVLSEGEAALRSAGENLVTFVADPSMFGPKEAKQDEEHNEEENMEEHIDEEAEESDSEDDDDSDEDEDNFDEDDNENNEKGGNKND